MFSTQKYVLNSWNFLNQYETFRAIKTLFNSRDPCNSSKMELFSAKTLFSTRRRSSLSEHGTRSVEMKFAKPKNLFQLTEQGIFITRIEIFLRKIIFLLKRSFSSKHGPSFNSKWYFFNKDRLFISKITFK